MARREALIRLHKSLMARRDELRRRIGKELDELSGVQSTDSTGDSADLAFGTGTEEVTSQLAELESREMNQINKALSRLRQGIYGLCEVCQKKIPVARLNALPFSTTCVQCQRELEMYGSAGSSRGDTTWSRVADSEGGEDRRIHISEIELDMSK